jgi:hypothetical protein
MSQGYQRRSGVTDDGLAEFGRRLAAAYLSYVAGHKGVDRMLKQAPQKPGDFWIDLADMVFTAMKSSGSAEDLQMRDAITKCIQ